MEAELIRYGATGIALALVGTLTLVIRAFIKNMEETRTQRNAQDKAFLETQKELMKSMDRLAKKVNKDISTTDELFKFMKTLNGDLRAVVHKKARGE